MKKLIFGLILVVCSLAVAGCVHTSNQRTQSEPQTEQQEPTTEVSADDKLNSIEGELNETVILKEDFSDL